MARQKILIVDDDPDDRDLIKQALNECIVAVEVAELDDGSNVLGYLEKHSKPTFIIVDLNMPIMNGFETLQEIRSNEKHAKIPVYIFTTSNSLRDKQHCIRLGATDVFVKPPSYAAWVHTLCALIDNRERA